MSFKYDAQYVESNVHDKMEAIYIFGFGQMTSENGLIEVLKKNLIKIKTILYYVR